MSKATVEKISGRNEKIVVASGHEIVYTRGMMKKPDEEIFSQIVEKGMPKMTEPAIAFIENEMAEVMLSCPYEAIVKEYECLLKVMGNVDGNEVVAMVLLAFRNVKGGQL